MRTVAVRLHRVRCSILHSQLALIPDDGWTCHCFPSTLRAAMSGFHGPVELTVQRSALLLRAYSVAHGLACGAVVLCYPPSFPRSLLLFALLVNAARGICAYWRPPTDAIVALKLDTRAAWQVRLRDGRTLSADLMGRPWVTAPITALSLRTSDRRARHVLLLADNTDADGLRRLRVQLRRRPDAAPAS